MSSRSAAARFSIIFFMRALPSGERLLDVVLPEASPRSRSVACTQRFQRGSISFAPVRYCRLKRKSSRRTPREAGRGAARDVPAQVRLPVRDRRALDHRVAVLEEGRLAR